ncbi:MAG TPA: hypothetical protein VMK12_23030, partial [Anaeromyxobacteraceae bacterium]|nr:hypothetical protein [Anaeromyxobacteraceae bacterium]
MNLRLPGRVALAAAALRELYLPLQYHRSLPQDIADPLALLLTRHHSVKLGSDDEASPLLQQVGENLVPVRLPVHHVHQL